MRHFHAILALTATATGLFAATDLIGFDDKKIETDDAPVKGIAQHPATEIGMDIAVTALGFDRVRARGPINKGDKLISAAAGGVKKAAAGAVNPFAVALTDAADGEFVTVLIR